MLANDDSIISATGTLSNLFMQMDDDEVGNYTSDSDESKTSRMAVKEGSSFNTPGRNSGSFKNDPPKKKQSSPQSVMDGVTAATKGRSRNSSVRSSKGTRRVVPRDITFDEESGTVTGDNASDTATGESIVDSRDGATTIDDGTVPGWSYSDRLIDKFQDFVMDEICSSMQNDKVGRASLVGKLQKGVQCAADSSTDAARAWVKETMEKYDYDGSVYDDEEDTDLSAEEDVANKIHRKPPSKRQVHASKGNASTAKNSNPRALPKAKKIKKKQMKSRRGRSPPSKLGHASDGESMSRHSSLSLSRVGSWSSVDTSMSGTGLSGNRSASTSVKTVAESDQAAWMAMTQRPGTRQDSHDGSIAKKGTPPKHEALEDDLVEMDMTQKHDNTHQDADDGSTAKKETPPKFGSLEDGLVEKYFKELLSSGIPLMLSDPPPISGNRYNHSEAAGLKQPGNMVLLYGNQSNPGSKQPCLVWTDGSDLSYTIELLDIMSIRKPTLFELDCYVFAIPAQSFVISTPKTTLSFEASSESEATDVIVALQKITSRLARKIALGEDDWMVQMLPRSSSMARKEISSLAKELFKNVVPHAKTDVTHLLSENTSSVPTKKVPERRIKKRV